MDLGVQARAAASPQLIWGRRAEMAYGYGARPSPQICPSSIHYLFDHIQFINALKWDTSFASNVKEIVILGGAFFALGNINPAAESNILQDPEAADIVFTSGANISVVGINITTQVKLTDEELQDIRNSNGKYAKIVTDMCVFYEAWTEKSDKFKGIFLHDPTCFVSLVRPDLFTYTQGVVRVQIEGKCRGLTLLDPGQKEWNSDNAWTVEVDGVGKPIVSVAMAAQVDEIRDYVKNLLMQP